MTTFAEKAIFATQIVAFRAEFDRLMSCFSWCQTGQLRNDLIEEVKGFIKAVRALRAVDDAFNALADEFADELKQH